MLNSFIASAHEFRLASALAKTLGRPVPMLGGNPDLVERANLKHVTRAKAIDLGVPVAPGEIVELNQARQTDGLGQALGRQLEQTGRALVRGSRGASGSATFLVEKTSDSIATALQHVEGRADNKVFLVEAMLDFMATTAGAMVASALTMARWLQGEGFTGLVGFDFIELRDPATGRRRHVLAETNPRTNGAAYPTFAMDRLNARQARYGRPAIGAFLSTSDLRTQLDCFAALRERCGSLLYDPRTGCGVLPYNTSSLARGRFHAVSFGATRAEVEDLHAKFRARIAD